MKSDSERESSSLRHLIAKGERELAACTESVEGLKTQKAELNKDLEVAKVKLAELQARLSDAQSTIQSYREKEKVSLQYTLLCAHIKC